MILKNPFYPVSRVPALGDTYAIAPDALLRLRAYFSVDPGSRMILGGASSAGVATFPHALISFSVCSIPAKYSFKHAQ